MDQTESFMHHLEWLLSPVSLTKQHAAKLEHLGEKGEVQGIWFTGTILYIGPLLPNIHFTC